MQWNELVKLALLGTERSTLSLAAKSALEQYGIDTSKEMTEVILEATALQAPLQKAGYEPAKWEGETINSSPKEVLDGCSRKSAKHLELILKGTYSPALSEFVETMQLYQKGLPFESLPDLLDKCVKDELLWRQIRPIIGERGKWLTQLNPRWQKLAPNISNEQWEIGTKAERIRLLTEMRRRNPSEGLQLLATTWSEEGLSEKTAFIKCLVIGLSPLDEPFLEATLDFPRKEVREIAATLLAQLPQSQLQQRIFSAAKKAIQLGQTEEGREKPIIQLPNTKDKDLIRDGISPKKKWKKGGEITGMLYQMVAIIPPERWKQYLQKSPSEILTFFAQSEWAMMLVEGLARAAKLHDADAWKEAILRFWLRHYTHRQWIQLDVSPILDSLSNEVFNAVLFEKLRAISFLPEEHSPLIQLLQKEQYIWEERLVNLVMNQLKTWIQENASYSWSGYQYRLLVKKAAYTVPPALEKKLSQFWLNDGYNWAGWEKDLQQFLTVLRFRREMLEELAGEEVEGQKG
ncbi:MAG: DUF5691 domain-containing protein [Bacteroidota bacterium]